MARDDLKVPRKTKTPPQSSSDESDSSNLFDEEDKLEEAQRRYHESLCADFAAAEQRNSHGPEGDNPEEPEDEEDVDMNEPAPDRDGRAVVIPWYETVLDTSEEVAISLYDDQDLKTPAHWASLCVTSR